MRKIIHKKGGCQVEGLPGTDYEKVFETVKNETVKIITNDDVEKDAQGDPNTKTLKDVLTNVTVSYEK